MNHGGSLSSHVNISCGMKLLKILRIVLLKILTFSLTLVFEKALAQLKPLIALQISSILASLYIIPKLNLAYTIWWWQFGCRDNWTPESIIKLGSDVKMRPMHEEEVFNTCVGSLIT